MNNLIKRGAVGVQWFLTKKAWQLRHIWKREHLFVAAQCHSDLFAIHFCQRLVNDHGRNLGSCHAFQAHVALWS